MNETAAFFYSKGEYFAGGFFEDPQREKIYRFSKAYRRYLEKCTLPQYRGGMLYPSGVRNRDNWAVRPHYSHTYKVDYARLKEIGCEAYSDLLKKEMDVVVIPKTSHNVGGANWIHAIPNYARVEAEGLTAYRLRVEALPDSDFRDGLLCLLEGIACYHGRLLEKLREENAPAQLIAALERVPFAPAQTLYEAIVCRNLIFYLDGCDNPGRLDADWIRLYRGEDCVALLEEFFDNVDANNGWTVALGPEYNELTMQVLKATGGHRRPSVELRVTKDMPDELWQAAAEAIRLGGGSPSLYNEELYQKSLRETFPQIAPEDIKKFCGGGCTETMLAGISRVGSLDAGINTAFVFSQVLREKLPESPSFESFWDALFVALTQAVAETLAGVRSVYRRRAQDVPQPIRTLLIDDCIDKGLDHNAGGARVTWSVVNFAGMINVIDSLLAVRELVYHTREYSAEEFIRLLDAEDEAFFARLRKCPCYGVDDEEADALATDFTAQLFALLDEHTPYLGGKYLASSIQHITYEMAGEPVPATPDGRKAGEPLCDSLAAVHGKDTQGPTALLNSVAKLAPALGTPVMNLRLRKDQVATVLKPLIQGFFAKGGMQAQITCASREDMEDALLHPERHENLIVRIGGYSEYFNRLSPDLKQSVIDRTEH